MLFIEAARKAGRKIYVAAHRSETDDLVAQAADDHPDILWFSAGVESFESIHKHSAYAEVLSDTMR